MPHDDAALCDYLTHTRGRSHHPAARRLRFHSSSWDRGRLAPGRWNDAYGICVRPPLSPEELDMIREQIEAMEDITAIDDEVRGIVERHWPHLVAKLPPRDE